MTLRPREPFSERPDPIDPIEEEIADEVVGDADSPEDESDTAGESDP